MKREERAFTRSKKERARYGFTYREKGFRLTHTLSPQSRSALGYFYKQLVTLGILGCWGYRAHIHEPTILQLDMSQWH